MTYHHLPEEQPDVIGRNSVDGRLWVIALQGDVDPETVDEVEEAVDLAMTASGAALLTFDLSGLRYCDSSLLNLLLRAARSQEVVLAGENTFMQRVLEVTGTGDLFTRVTTLEAAHTLSGR
ncbi:STAS domain-containing protein [Streptomyces xanthochromogenes]|uniref:STAS domain-containing protein n=1 Tax=Streptomyces xanthochromogenes TaxID=67384 RepID=UPI003445738F